MAELIKILKESKGGKVIDFQVHDWADIKSDLCEEDIENKLKSIGFDHAGLARHFPYGINPEFIEDVCEKLGYKSPISGSEIKYYKLSPQEWLDILTYRSNKEFFIPVIESSIRFKENETLYNAHICIINPDPNIIQVLIDSQQNTYDFYDNDWTKELEKYVWFFSHALRKGGIAFEWSRNKIKDVSYINSSKLDYIEVVINDLNSDNILFDVYKNGSQINNLREAVRIHNHKKKNPIPLLTSDSHDEEKLGKCGVILDVKNFKPSSLKEGFRKESYSVFSMNTDDPEAGIYYSKKFKNDYYISSILP